MPLRPLPPQLVSRLQKTFFHTSPVLRAGGRHPNHYETLQIPVNATPSEVKKSFYSLSKTHHPDRNPDDPSASQRFVQISEAYSILGTPAKRQEYDRSHIHPTQSHQQHYSAHPQHGSYHSSNPAGGRPASGLSRRRTQFRGPPPSFYRSGGWGEHSAKRRAAQENGAPGAEAPPDTSAEFGGGMGTGQAPFGQSNDVPHFDREGHYRTHENHTKRWQKRMGENTVPSGTVEPSPLASFFVVGGIITLGIFIPSLMFDKLSRKGKEDKR